MQLISQTLMKIPMAVIELHPSPEPFIRSSSLIHQKALLFGLRDNKEKYRPLRIIVNSPVTKDGCLLFDVCLYGRKSEFVPLQGRIDVLYPDGKEKGYDYDIRYIEETSADTLIEKGIATTVAEQKRLHDDAIAKDCEKKGLDLSRMIEKTLKFIKETKDG